MMAIEKKSLVFVEFSGFLPWEKKTFSNSKTLEDADEIL